MGRNIAIQTDGSDRWETDSRLVGTIEAVRQTMYKVAEYLEFEGDFPVVVLQKSPINLKTRLGTKPFPSHYDNNTLTLYLSSSLCFSRCRDSGYKNIRVPQSVAYYTAYCTGLHIQYMINSQKPPKLRIAKVSEDPVVRKICSQMIVQSMKDLFNIPVRFT